MNSLVVVEAIKKKFTLIGSPASIPLLRKPGIFTAELTDSGVNVDNLAGKLVPKSGSRSESLLESGK